MARISKPCSYIECSWYGAVAIVADRQEWQLFTKHCQPVLQFCVECLFFSIEKISFKWPLSLLTLWVWPHIYHKGRVSGIRVQHTCFIAFAQKNVSMGDLGIFWLIYPKVHGLELQNLSSSSPRAILGNGWLNSKMILPWSHTEMV